MPTTRTTSNLFNLFWKYRDLFLRYGWKTLAGLLMLVIVNIAGVSIPWMIKHSVETIQGILPGVLSPPYMKTQWIGFYQGLGIIAGLAAISLISRILSRMFLLGVGRYVEFDLRNRLFSHLLKMPTSYYAAHPSGELMSRMINDVDATKFLTGGGLMLGGNTLFAYLLVIPMMIHLNWQLSLVTFLFYPVIIWIMGKISKKVRIGYREVQEVLADVSTIAQENISGMMVIQSYAREEQEAKRFQAISERYYGTYTKLIHERILLFMVLAGLSGFSTCLVLLVGGGEVIGKQLSWGGFVAFTMYLEYLAWPTMALGWMISTFQQGTAALERLDEVFSTESDIQIKPDTSPAKKVSTSDPAGALGIQNLTFTYRNPYIGLDNELPATTGKPVLQNINLNIRPGETIALVGPVGSGKSTLLRLLPRLYDIPADSIFLDGQDITQLELSALRKAIVFMPQLSFLFSTTIRQNIAFGEPDMLEQQDAESQLISVAQAASIHEDVLSLTNQYQTLVGERGVMLSGGQRQRVALARAILLDAPLLILDDPFSNVDADTERNIINALQTRKVFQGKTTLIATHRFSLVSLCDRVVLMDAGHILAVGTHGELLETQPLYRKLHRLQELRDSLGSWGMAPDTLPANHNGTEPAEWEEELETLEAALSEAPQQEDA